MTERALIDLLQKAVHLERDERAAFLRRINDEQPELVAELRALLEPKNTVAIDRQPVSALLHESGLVRHPEADHSMGLRVDRAGWRE